MFSAHQGVNTSILQCNTSTLLDTSTQPSTLLSSCNASLRASSWNVEVYVAVNDRQLMNQSWTYESKHEGEKLTRDHFSLGLIVANSSVTTELRNNLWFGTQFWEKFWAIRENFVITSRQKKKHRNPFAVKITKPWQIYTRNCSSLAGGKDFCLNNSNNFGIRAPRGHRSGIPRKASRMGVSKSPKKVQNLFARLPGMWTTWTLRAQCVGVCVQLTPPTQKSVCMCGKEWGENSDLQQGICPEGSASDWLPLLEVWG